MLFQVSKNMCYYRLHRIKGQETLCPLFSKIHLEWGQEQQYTGITMSGAFSFISDLYSGVISDHAITIVSGWIEKLETMDDVMADRGFNLRDLVAKRNVTLNIPPFAKGKQLSTKACTKTRKIASHGIHVEWAIQRRKKSSLLQRVIPISVAVVDNQAVFVCAALCNLLKPLVKK